MAKQNFDRKTRKLIKKLEHKDPKTRFDAVLDLGLTGNVELLDPLEKVANLDDHPRVRDLASKAVRTLGTLQKREEERRLREADMIARKGEKYDWKELSSDKMFNEERAVSNVEAQEDWSYVDQKVKDKQRLSREQRLAQMEEEERKRYEAEQKRRRRRPFRLFLIFATVIAIIGLVLVAWYITNVEPPPGSRQEVLESLRDWVQREQAAIIAYQEELEKDPLNCTTFGAVELPKRPRWAVLYMGDDTADGLVEGMANDLSRIDSGLIQGEVETAFNDARRAHARLSEYHEVVQTVIAICDDENTLPLGEWEAFESQQGIGGVLVQSLRSANNAASIIEQQLNPPQEDETGTEG